MAVQIIATHADGDQRHEFALDDKDAVAKAMQRFTDLVKNQKYTAYNPGKDGKGASLVRSFEESLTHDTVVLMPQRQGG